MAVLSRGLGTLAIILPFAIGFAAQWITDAAAGDGATQRLWLVLPAAYLLGASLLWTMGRWLNKKPDPPADAPPLGLWQRLRRPYEEPDHHLWAIPLQYWALPWTGIAVFMVLR